MNKGDDMCDLCFTSGVEVACTIDGKTACAECAEEFHALELEVGNEPSSLR